MWCLVEHVTDKYYVSLCTTLIKIKQNFYLEDLWPNHYPMNSNTFKSALKCKVFPVRESLIYFCYMFGEYFSFHIVQFAVKFQFNVGYGIVSIRLTNAKNKNYI